MFKRKHCSQMVEDELALVSKKVKACSLEDWRVSGHLMNRMVEKGISPLEIAEAIVSFSVIEYKLYNEGEERVLIRGKASHKGYQICVVLNVSDGVIVTVWKNHIKDNHSTIKMSEYDAHLIIK